MSYGTLFVVATPIGNLDDLSARAAQVLRDVAVIAAEDTRRTGTLLSAIAVATPTISLHEHNESGRIPGLLERLAAGEDIALVSDAGTPLIADPGYRLVQAARDVDAPVVPIPGPSAITAALSVAGVATDRFLFLGFLPARRSARLRAIEALRSERATLVLYEAPHRISALLADLVTGLGAGRRVWVGRELTKRYESQRHGTLADVSGLFEAGEEPERGEFVVVVAGATREGEADAQEGSELDVDALLRALLAELPASRAARVAAKATGLRRSTLYDRALELAPAGE